MSTAPATGRKVLRGAHALGAGALFGTGLIVSGMYDPARVLAFLDVSGNWDPSLAFVMLGAIAAAAPFFALARTRRNRNGKALTGEPLPADPPSRIDWRLIAGALVFGVGWGLSGYCPGPALLSPGLGATTALPFIAAMLAGAALYGLVTRTGD